jgi:uncharacterized protein (UPF0548 family)
MNNETIIKELLIASFLKHSTQYLSQPHTKDAHMGNTTELDIQSFIATAQDDVPSDQAVRVPEDTYTMFVKPGSTKIITGEGEKGLWAMYTAQAVVDSEKAREATNLENPSAKVRFFLDITEASTADQIILAKGANRNTMLGKLLKATGNDRPGWTYGAIEGVSFQGRVKHVVDRKNAERVDAEVVTYAKV